MYASTGTYNPCYTQNRDCSIPNNSVYRETGQYSFHNDTLKIKYAMFAAIVPPRVPPDWHGPDTFTTTSPAFVPQYTVTVRSP